MLRTYGLTHVALAVRDVARSSRFYQEVFGCVEVYRQQGLAQLQTPGTHDVLVLEEAPDRAGVSGGVVHFGFRLADPGDIGRAGANVVGAGGTVREQGEFVPGEPYLFAIDPDGNEFEIWYELPTPIDPRSSLLALEPIGYVRSPFTATAQIPKGRGAEHHAEGVLELRPHLEAGLTDIEGFSHLYAIWLFDRASGYELVGVPPTDTRPHGVFATRSPRRPNPIGLTVLTLLRREAHRLFVRGVDMLDGTPVLDIKPYLSSVPAETLRLGWLEDATRPQR